jgi:hypothetical protein
LFYIFRARDGQEKSEQDKNKYRDLCNPNAILPTAAGPTLSAKAEHTAGDSKRLRCNPKPDRRVHERVLRHVA